MKKRFKKWWFREMVLPYMMHNKAQCSEVLIDTTIYQLWYAGVGYQHINKWLQVMNHKTIKAYAMAGPNKDQVRLFYEYPTTEQRRAIKGNLVIIGQ